MKSKLYELESGIEIQSERKLVDIRNSYEKNEKLFQQQLKETADIAIKKSKELEEALDLITSIQRSFQGSLDMSISLANYFQDKVTKGGQ